MKPTVVRKKTAFENFLNKHAEERRREQGRPIDEHAFRVNLVETLGKQWKVS